MFKTRHLIFVFIPALLLVMLALFIRIVQYSPLAPKEKKDTAGKTEQFVIPIFTDDAIIGSKKAPITIITFEDFGCPSCKAQDAIMGELMKTYPNKIKVIWKPLSVTHFPFSSELAHRYGYCADRQGKFSEFKQFAFENGDNLSEGTLKVIAEQMKLDAGDLTACLTAPETQAHLDKNTQLGVVLNIQTVPTFFIDNTQIPTPQSVEQWRAVLNL